MGYDPYRDSRRVNAGGEMGRQPVDPHLSAAPRVPALLPPGPKEAVIRFSESEMWTCRNLATWRNDPKMERGTPSNKMGPKSEWQVHLDGVMTEYAVATFFAVPMDLRILLGGDGNKQDLFLGPWRTSIKFAEYDPPYLKFFTIPEFHQDVAILGGKGPEPQSITLHGWVTPARFRERQKPRPFGHGERPSVGPEDLWPLADLKAQLYDIEKHPVLRSWRGG